MNIVEHAALEEAIKAGRTASVTVACKDGPVQWTVRLETAPRREGQRDRELWCVLEEGPKGKLEEARRGGLNAEVTFLINDALIMFNTVILEVHRKGVLGRRLKLGYPATLHKYNRRANKREPVPEDMELVAEVEGWGKATARVWDLNEKGIGLLCPNHLVQSFQPGQALEINIRRGERRIVIVGKVCNGATLAPQTARVGLSISYVSTTSKAMLEELVAELAELRETRYFRRELGGRRVGQVA